MAQFDVYRGAQGELLVDCQSDALENLGTRIVAPLIPIAEAPERKARLNPVFDVDGERYAMVTQFATAVRTGELRQHAAHLGNYRFDIIGAFDMLLTGV